VVRRYPGRRWLDRSLREMVTRDHRMSPAELRRRQWVTVGFVVLGAVVLGVSLRVEPGSPWFYPLTFALAGVWTVGAFASGRLHLGHIVTEDPDDEDGVVRPVVQPVAIGLALAGVFVVGALVVREIPLLSDQVEKVLGFATEGALPVLVVVTAVNGVAEELFFRGAAYAAIPRNPVAWTTVAYTVATLATGNVMLAFAAILLGVVVGLQRRASGGILAPVLTHCTWSLTMLLALPPIFGLR
jgi:membrane protease YdiL (CAAX protease family)